MDIRPIPMHHWKTTSQICWFSFLPLLRSLEHTTLRTFFTPPIYSLGGFVFHFLFFLTVVDNSENSQDFCHQLSFFEISSGGKDGVGTYFSVPQETLLSTTF